MRSGTSSFKVFSEAKKIFPGGVNSPVRAFKSVGLEPFVVQRGEGACLYDLDGNRYIDYVMSWGPLVLGHAHPKVVAAIQEQAKLSTSYGACGALEPELGKIVLEHFPSIEMLRFVNSGTEAGMTVIRLARAFTKRDKILKFSGCYHGHVDSLLVKAGSGVATLGLPDSPGVPASFAENTLTCQFNNLEEVEAVFSKIGESIAAVVLEPVVGNAGLIPPEPGFLDGLRSITKKFGALLIFDEVMTGFRVSLKGAQGLYGVSPDLTMFGKVIGGGLPVGAFGGRREIMELLAPIGPVYQAGTLSGNPLAMAAGIATISEWSNEKLFKAVSDAATDLVDFFVNTAKINGVPLIGRSVGTMFGVFFQSGPVRNYEEAKGSDVKRFAKFFGLLLDRGVFLPPSQFEAMFLSSAHLGEPISKTKEAIESAFKELKE